MDERDARTLHNRPAAVDSERPWSLLLLLMAMTAIGPTTLNIIVPAIPQLATRLHADIATVQLTVSVYLLALASGQLVMGPLSDKFGRRRVILAALTLTTVASVVAVAVATVESLIAARVAQAFGASAGIVVSRAIMRDLFDKNRAASMIGLVATVMVVVPTLGPLIGGLLDTAFGWEAIFLFTAITTAVVVTWAFVALPETAALNAQPGVPQAGFLRDLAVLSRNGRFWGYVSASAFGSATFFIFLGGGPHVVVTLMQRSPAEFGVWFAFCSLGYMAGNYTTSRLTTRIGIDRMIWAGIAVEAIGVLVGWALASFAPQLGPTIVFVPQLIVNYGNGLLLPGAIAGAVSVRPQAAGAAAGITGFGQMALGAAATQFAGMLMAVQSTAVPLALMMVASVTVLLFSFAVLVRRPPLTG